MNPHNPFVELSLVEAKLFAGNQPAVIDAIDDSDDVAEATTRLQELGLTELQAAAVLDMPLRLRTRAERQALFREAERLRDLTGDSSSDPAGVDVQKPPALRDGDQPIAS